MRNLSNIEAHPSLRGVYVGYCNGPWRIRRDHARLWVATKQDGSASRVFTGLHEANEWLAARNGR
jgi:hypothetical protein